MINLNHKVTRTIRKHQLNMQLSILHTFTPVNSYEIYCIHKSTSTMLLYDLIQEARKTTMFTIDTECDYYTHRPALIQIEFIQEQQSIVVLIETLHLPHQSSVLFWLIKSLLKVIFHSSNHIFSWGDGQDELMDFISYGIFSTEMLAQINCKDIQKRFKRWHNDLLEHHCCCSWINNNNILSAYSHKSRIDSHHKWSLQMAIAYAFSEFLDKSQTKNCWSQHMDLEHIEQSSYKMNSNKMNQLKQMINYAANDCLAVTKLILLLNLDSML